MYVFIDTETTGLPTRRGADVTEADVWPRIVQMGWIVYDDAGSEVSRESYIIKTDGFAIPDDAADIHGITTEIAEKEGHPLRFVLERFMQTVNLYNTIIAHNVDFDIPIIACELHREGMTYTKLLEKDSYMHAKRNGRLL